MSGGGQTFCVFHKSFAIDLAVCCADIERLSGARHRKNSDGAKNGSLRTGKQPLCQEKA